MNKWWNKKISYNVKKVKQQNGMQWKNQECEDLGSRVTQAEGPANNKALMW